MARSIFKRVCSIAVAVLQLQSSDSALTTEKVSGAWLVCNILSVVWESKRGEWMGILLNFVLPSMLKTAICEGIGLVCYHGLFTQSGFALSTPPGSQVQQYNLEIDLFHHSDHLVQALRKSPWTTFSQ